MRVYLKGKDAPGAARCASCNAPITWVRNIATGKRMPIDGDRSCVKIVEGGQGEVDLRATPSHFASCPQAKGWRRR